jgi:hypothetical protein
VAVSIAGHAVVLTALALHAPRLAIPHEQAGPPEPIIPILIMPRTPPPPPGSLEKPQPIRLHRRQLRNEPLPPPETPAFIVPKEIPTPPPPTPRAPAQPRITVQPSPRTQLSTMLRSGLVGCANPGLLTAEERARCEERLGSGAHDLSEPLPSIAPDRQADFDRAAQAKQRAREPGVPIGPASPESDSGPSYRNKPPSEPTIGPLRP